MGASYMAWRGGVRWSLGKWAQGKALPLGKLAQSLPGWGQLQDRARLGHQVRGPTGPWQHPEQRQQGQGLHMWGTRSAQHPGDHIPNLCQAWGSWHRKGWTEGSSVENTKVLRAGALALSQAEDREVTQPGEESAWGEGHSRLQCLWGGYWEVGVPHCSAEWEEQNLNLRGSDWIQGVTFHTWGKSNPGGLCNLPPLTFPIPAWLDLRADPE